MTWTNFRLVQIAYDETPFMKLSTTPGKSKIVRVKFLSTWSLKGHNFQSEGLELQKNLVLANCCKEIV